MTAPEYAQGLRGIAEWYETHPDIPIPHDTIISIYGLQDSKEEAVRIIEALKPCRKEWQGDFLKITRDFGGTTLKFVFRRIAICTSRLVRVERIEAVFIPAHDQNIFEWDCEPALLAGAVEQEATA